MGLRKTSDTAPAPRLRFDRQVLPDLRVRLWEYSARHTLVSAAGAHPFVEVAFIDSGRVSYRIGRRTFEVGAGQMIVVPAGVEHATGFEEGLRGGAVYLRRDLLDEAGDAMGLRPSKAHPTMVAAPRRARHLLRLLCDEAEQAARGSTFALSGLADAAAVEILRGIEPANEIGAPREENGLPRSPSARVRDPRVRRAIERIEAAPEAEISVDDLAKTAAMSRFHFSRVFREATGQSPYRYLLEARLARAMVLLRTDRFSVTEVAFACGFNDLGRFAKQFREHFGRSPGSVKQGRSCVA